MQVRGIRGATTVEENTRKAILTATKELLEELAAANNLQPENIASIIFSMTSDLNQEFPAVAARELGWTEVPLFDSQELEIEGTLSQCIRVLIHYNTEQSQSDINHVYLRRAKQLRPDLVEGGD